nr:hypothetical protein [Alloactinosynnema sp. L-07]
MACSYQSKRQPQSESVWLERNDTEPPDDLPQLPESWPDRYQRLAAGHSTEIPPYLEAVAHVTQLWLNMFPSK